MSDAITWLVYPYLKTKNPAYRRHWIFQRVPIVEPLPKRTQTKRKCHFLLKKPNKSTFGNNTALKSVTDKIERLFGIWHMLNKNTLHGRHWISQHVRIIAPIPKRTETDRKVQKKEETNVSRVRCQVSCVTFCVSPVTATDPPPANYPIIHSRLASKDHLQQQDLIVERGQ